MNWLFQRELFTGDREAKQEEINALLAESDGIADRTEFNTQNFLKGDFENIIFHLVLN